MVGIIIVGKALLTFALVLYFRRPVRSALLIAASLAQIGEFSFILAGLGIALGLLPELGRDLILAGALVSITLNPLVFRATEVIERWIEGRPNLVLALERAEVPVGAELARERESSLRDHVILIGYGRVGRRIGDALRRANIPYIVVERDRVAVENLRTQGVPAIFGDAARPGILDHVHLETARLLIIAAPDAYHARRVIEIARKSNPGIHIAARTHSEAGQQFLERLGVDRAFMGERELALSMAHYALLRMGRTDDEADVTVEEMRRTTKLGVRPIPS